MEERPPQPHTMPHHTNAAEPYRTFYDAGRFGRMPLGRWSREGFMGAGRVPPLGDRPKSKSPELHTQVGNAEADKIV